MSVMLPVSYPTLSTMDFAIGGKMLIASMEVPEYDAKMIFSDDELKQNIRQKLVYSLCEGILDNNYCETTSIQNTNRLSTTIYARVYLAPNDQVKILRLSKT